jgi:hypothetical protein
MTFNTKISKPQKIAFIEQSTKQSMKPEVPLETSLPSTVVCIKHLP